VLLAVPAISTFSSRPPPRCVMCAFRDSDADRPGVGVVLDPDVNLASAQERFESRSTSALTCWSLTV
jgi:hypothetical protein